MLSGLKNETMRKLADLAVSFQAGLPDRFFAINENFDNAMAAPHVDLAREYLSTLRHDVHKLAGSAGMYGIPDISTRARKLELICDAVLDGEKPDHPARHYSELNFHVNALTVAECDPPLELEDAIVAANTPLWIEKTSSLQPGARNWGELATRKTVLLIDDDSALAALLKAQLGIFGFELEWKDSPNGLAEHLATLQPAAVIMDVSFPGDEDAGFNAISTLRAEGVIDCPVIFLSQRSDIAARLGAHRAHCSDYLVKPIDISDLVSSLVHKISSEAQKPYRVLIVDDDSEVCDHYQTLLEGIGFDVTATTNPMRTLDIVHEFSPDSILMDIHMPECSGIEIASVLGQDKGLLHIPIIFLTSDTSEERKLIATLSGGDEFLIKSSDPEFIIGMVKARAHRYRDFKRKIERVGRSESHFRLLAQRVADAIVSVDSAGRVIQWNKAAAGVFGYQEKEILGLPISRLFPQNRGDERMGRLYGGEEGTNESLAAPAPFETSALTKDGVEISVEMSVTHWPSDAEWHCTAIIRDVTERKKTEIEIRKNRERFRTMAEQSSDWIWETDADHRVSYLSEGLSKHAGISMERFLGRRRGEYTGLEVNNHHLKKHLEDLRNHRSFRNFEYTVEADNGNTVYLSISGTPMFSDDGEFAGYIGTGTNNTQLKLSQMELERQRTLFETIFNAIPNAVVFSSPDRRFVATNPGFEKIFGYSTEDVLDEETSILFSQYDDFTNLGDEKFCRLPEEVREPFEVLYLRGSGQSFIGETMGTIVHGPGGEVVGNICVITDVSQRKDDEEKIARHHLELQEKIDEATRELNAKSEALASALAAEKQVNKIQRQFVSMASHELRTPLAIIDSTAQRLPSLFQKPDQERGFNKKVLKIRGAVDRLTSLIESTLAAEKLDSGKTEFIARACNLRTLVLDACERQREICETHSITTNLETLPVQINADAGKLDQVFTNLLTNAIKYSPDADGIEVHGWQESGQAVISVTDHGLGIPEDEQSKVFDRFFRASSAHGFVGTGIGLYLVKEFVSQHGGSAAVKSADGGGTTVTIRLPIVTSENAQVIPRANVYPEEAESLHG